VAGGFFEEAELGENPTRQGNFFCEKVVGLGIFAF